VNWPGHPHCSRPVCGKPIFWNGPFIIHTAASQLENAPSRLEQARFTNVPAIL
jgi:hypothetical protein